MKIRTDFVTNSSSSSFVLAYADEGEALRDILSLLGVKREDVNYYEEDCDTKRALGDFLLDITYEKNRRTIEQIKKDYEEENEYDIRCDIESKIRQKTGMNMEEFKEWKKEHQAEIQKKIKAKIKREQKKLEEKAGEKKLLVELEYEDHWPESILHEALKKSEHLVTVFDMH